MRRVVARGILAVVLCLWGGASQAEQVNAVLSPATDGKVFLPVIFKSFFARWVWSSPVAIKLTPEPNHVVMAFDKSQAPHVIWDKSPWVTGEASIYHTYRSGTSWTPTETVASISGDAETLWPPSLSPDGFLHLLWRVSNVGGPYALNYAAWNGEGWVYKGEFLSETDDPYPTGMVGINAAGEASIVGMYGTSIGTMVEHRIFHFDWLEWDPIGVIDGVRQAWPDASNGARIYGDDIASGQGWYQYWAGGSQQGSAGLGEMIGDRVGVLDGSGNMHLFHLDMTGGAYGLFHQCLDKDLNWGPIELVSGTAKLSGYPSQALQVAVSSQGNIAAAYLDDQTQAVGLLTWQDCRVRTQGALVAPAGTSGLDALAFGEAPGKLCVLRDTSGSNKVLVCARLVN